MTLNAKNLQVKIGNKILLKNINLQIPPKEVVAVIGPNGAGKTTLLRAITGDLNISQGLVTFNNNSFNNKTLNQWPREEIATALAVLPQSNHVSFAFKVEEVVAMGRTPHNTGTIVDHDFCQQAMRTLDITHLAKQSYPTLSGGEKQRVQLARVMVQIWQQTNGLSRLLVLDEPTHSLDLGHQRQLMETIKQFATNGSAVLMAIHDISLAAAYSDKIIALKNGEIVAQGPPSEVITEKTISELFDTPVSIIAHPSTGKPLVVNH